MDYTPYAGKLIAARYYAIRQKSTGNFMPATKRRAGFTNDKPVNPKELPPRLFSSRRAAQQALDWWLIGAWHQKFAPDSFEGPEEVRLEVRRKPGRKADDMEVITVRIAEVEVEVDEPSRPTTVKAEPEAESEVYGCIYCGKGLTLDDQVLEVCNDCAIREGLL